MPEWFETFPDEAVLARTLTLSRRSVIGFALTSGALVSAAPVAALLLPRGIGSAIAVACGLALVAHAVWLVVRLGELHRTVWCLRLSARHVSADNGGRRRLLMPWPGVLRLDLGREALTIDGMSADGSATKISIPTDFKDHDALARRLVDYAVAHHCVLCIDGEPIQNVSIAGALATRRPTAGLADDERVD